MLEVGEFLNRGSSTIIYLFLNNDGRNMPNISELVHESDI